MKSNALSVLPYSQRRGWVGESQMSENKPAVEEDKDKIASFISVLSEDDKILCDELARDKASNVKNRFLEALKKIESSSQYTSSNAFKAPYGYFRGRPMIGEETQVNGGIFVSSGPHESIVIDEKYGYLAQVLENLTNLSEQREKEGKNFKQGILSDVAYIVQRTLKFNPGGVTKLLKDRGIGIDSKVSLDLFIEAKVGVARHQILLTAYLIEKLKKRGLLHGKFALDPRIKRQGGEDERLFYINSVGKVFVVDPLKSVLESQSVATNALTSQKSTPAPGSKGYDFMH